MSIWTDLAMVRAMNESGMASDVAENVRKHGGKYGRYRVWEHEDESDGRIVIDARVRG